MKNKLFLSIILSLGSLSAAYAQQDAFKWRIGAYTGAGFSTSDIALTASPSFQDLNYGLSGEYFFNKAWAAKAVIGIGQATANDRSFQGTNFTRGLNAQTRFQDISLMASYYFDNERNMSEVAKFAPYFTAGLGFCNFAVFADLRDANGALYTNDYNKKDWTQDGTYETNISKLKAAADYPTIAITIPFGLGLKYRLNDRINVNLEAIAKLALTDNFEDATGAFRTDFPSDFTAEQFFAEKPNKSYTGVRGDKATNDMYGHIGLSVHYNFGLKAVDNIDIPIIYIPQAEKPVVITDPDFNRKPGTTTAPPVNIKPSAESSDMPAIVDNRKISNYFKTKDTISAAVADVERMRLEIAYINRDLAAMDTTKNNSAFIQSQSSRLVEIRNKAKEYHKFGAGTPQDQEKVKEINSDLQNERKETLVSINILTLPTSDKSKVIDNLRKKDALNDGFIARQEQKINDLRKENGLMAVSNAPAVVSAKNPNPIAAAANEKPVVVAKAPVVVVEPTKPVAVAKAPVAVVEPTKPLVVAKAPVAVVEPTKPVVVAKAPVAVVEPTKPVAVIEKTAVAKSPEVIAAEARVKEIEAKFAAIEATQQAAIAQKDAELKRKDEELKRKEEELNIVKKSVKEESSMQLVQKDKEIAVLNARLAEIEAMLAGTTPTKEPVSAAPATTVATPKNEVATPVKTAQPRIVEAATPINKEAVKIKVEALKKDIAIKEQQKQKLKDTKSAANNQIWFIPNDGNLTPVQMNRLNQIIAFMKENPNARVDLKPFIEPGMKNPDLPYERADNVKNYLMNRGGISLDRIQVAIAGTGSVQVGKKWVSGRRVEVRFLVSE